MDKKRSRIHIGLRTVKTVIAVIVSMIVVDSYGATTSKLIFAMLGAMAAVQPTFKESLESCLTQIVGVFFGGIAGVLLMQLPVHPLVATGIGMVLVITFYNAFRIRFSPSLPCFIVVMVCTTPDVQPMSYAFGRIWDSAIGLGIGMLINSLIFPYDNSRQIRSTVESLDRELISFLEEMFDGDDVLPDADAMTGKIDDMARQLKVFANQKLIMNLRRQREELERFKRCEGKARQLVAQMEVLSRIGVPGRLSEENRSRLTDCGANIRDERVLSRPINHLFDAELKQSFEQFSDTIFEADVVTNYHVGQILTLRQELLEALKGKVEK